MTDEEIFSAVDGGTMSAEEGRMHIVENWRSEDDKISADNLRWAVTMTLSAIVGILPILVWMVIN